MGKYVPKFKWDNGQRTVRVMCGMCPDWGMADASMALARAHLAAHPTHIVGIVTTAVILLSVDADTDAVRQTPVPIVNGLGHVQG